MDQRAVEATREHYNRHSLRHDTSEQALQARRSGESYPLKNFHNQIKRQLLYRFAYGVDTLLDFACGRGGDILKWMDAEIKYVKGIDLAPLEVEEAARRYSEATAKRSSTLLRCEFEATDALGLREWREPHAYDAVSCMFSIHYFFSSAPALKNMLHNVVINLKDGGYFIGTFPDGKRVQEALHGARNHYDSRLLQLHARWEGMPQPFGSAYSCAIGDTVTQGHGDSKGSYEYLVFRSVLKAVAAEVGLKPVLDYGFAPMEALFEPGDAREPFKHFNPVFPGSDPSLERASRLFCAFAFQKTAGAVSLPPVPPIMATAGGSSWRGRGGAPSSGRFPKRQRADNGGWGEHGGGGYGPPPHHHHHPEHHYPPPDHPGGPPHHPGGGHYPAPYGGGYAEPPHGGGAEYYPPPGHNGDFAPPHHHHGEHEGRTWGAAGNGAGLAPPDGQPYPPHAYAPGEHSEHAYAHGEPGAGPGLGGKQAGAYPRDKAHGYAGHERDAQQAAADVRDVGAGGAGGEWQEEGELQGNIDERQAAGSDAPGKQTGEVPSGKDIRESPKDDAG